MQFRIADTFTTSLARLPNEHQRAAKATAFDLQTNIAHPSLSLHRVTSARDPGLLVGEGEPRPAYHPAQGWGECRSLLRGQS